MARMESEWRILKLHVGARRHKQAMSGVIGDVGGSMNPGHAHLSLSDFKEKTDRQLIILVRNQIEQSLRLARRNPGPDAEALYRQAEKLLAVARPSETERVELESLLAQVREALDARPHRAMTSARSAWC